MFLCYVMLNNFAMDPSMASLLVTADLHEDPTS